VSSVRLLRECPNGNGVARARNASPTKWTEAHRAEARRLHAKGGLSWAEIALQVCGDRRYKPTVGLWLKPVRDATSTPQRSTHTQDSAIATIRFGAPQSL
jgi:hypothetical protein